jgi:hypothetical protein
MCKDNNQMKEYLWDLPYWKLHVHVFLYPQGISNSNLCLQKNYNT